MNMERIKFSSHTLSFDEATAFVTHLPLNINGKKELLNQLNEKLKFPEYFGFNWDGLLDVLCDFNWIEQYNIILIHDDLPILSEKELRIYIEILSESIESWRKWKDGQQHHLEVVFPEKAREVISKYWNRTQ